MLSHFLTNLPLPSVDLSPYSTKKRVCVGSSLRHLTHEMYMSNAKTRRQAPNATYIPLEYRLRLLPNAKKSTQKKRNVHGQLKKIASPNARDTIMLVFLVLGDAKVLSFALGDAKAPDAKYFAFWWNIGLRGDIKIAHSRMTKTGYWDIGNLFVIFMRQVTKTHLYHLLGLYYV